MDWETYVRNLSQMGPRKLKMPLPDASGARKEPETQEKGRTFLLEGEVVQDHRPWPMPGDEWVMNGKMDETFRPDPAKRKEILERVLDPFLSEEETLAVLMVPKTRLREAVNRRHLAMYRDLSGARFFRLSEVLELAQSMGQGHGPKTPP